MGRNLISATNTRTSILASLTAGFHGFISKSQSEDQVVNAINDLLSKQVGPSGEIVTRLRLMPQNAWQVVIRDHHEGYIDWDRFVAYRHPITAAEILNDRVLPFFEEHGIALTRVLTDRGTEYCGNPEHHEYELYLAIEDVDHTRTKTKSPQTNGICERFHKTVLNEFYRVAFRKTLYRSIAELQADLDRWMKEYNELRSHQGRWCFGKRNVARWL